MSNSDQQQKNEHRPVQRLCQIPHDRCLPPVKAQQPVACDEVIPETISVRESLWADQNQPVEPVLAKRMVLVIEDDFRVRRFATKVLEQHGYTVTSAVNGLEGLMILKSDYQVHLVFADIFLPGGINGHAIANWLQEHRPTVPVLLTTGFTVPKEAQPVAGQRKIMLKKPYSDKELLTEVELLLR